MKIHTSKLVSGRDAWAKVLEDSECIQCCSFCSHRQYHLLLAMTHDHVQGALPTREALSSLGVQRLYWALSDRHGGLPHNRGYWADLPPPTSLTISHTDRLAGQGPQQIKTFPSGRTFAGLKRSLPRSQGQGEILYYMPRNVLWQKMFSYMKSHISCFQN